MIVLSRSKNAARAVGPTPADATDRRLSNRAVHRPACRPQARPIGPAAGPRIARRSAAWRTVVGVLGGSGGVGASTFAAVARVGAPAGGADRPRPGGRRASTSCSASTTAPGARWSGLRSTAAASIPTLLAAGLPRWRGCAVLAADVPPRRRRRSPRWSTAAARVGAGRARPAARSPAPLREAAARVLRLRVLVAAAADVRWLVAAARACCARCRTCRSAWCCAAAGSAWPRRPSCSGVPLLGVLPRRRPRRPDRLPAPSRRAAAESSTAVGGVRAA